MFDLTALNGTNGFTIPGLEIWSGLGISVSFAGDVNQDGNADLILGANGIEGGTGTVYVIFGQKSNLPASFNLANLNGSNGFSIPGLITGDRLGTFVGSAGDVNGDGKADIIMGAGTANSLKGAVYVVFGQGNSSYPASFNLASLNGTNGFTIPGLIPRPINGDDLLREHFSSAGDINDDGNADLMISIPMLNTDTGVVYVIFGQNSSYPASFDLTTLNGSNGFNITGLNTGDRLGYSVSSAGDVNQDGKADIVIGAPYVNSRKGAAYVVFGQGNSSYLASFDLTTLNGSNGFTITGITPGDQLGAGVSSAGDVNGDGEVDLILGAEGVNSDAGAVYVIFGQNSSYPASFDLTTLNGSNGFNITGITTGSYTGLGHERGLGSIGDINGDGKADIIMGASRVGPGGTVYVIFGQGGGFPASFNLTSLNGANGFSIPALGMSEYFELLVSSSAGDFNGDGKNDFIIGTPCISNPCAAYVYVIFGQNFNRGPQLVHNILDQIAEFNKSFSFQIASAFNDTDSDVLRYSAVQSGSSTLPSWLNFDRVKGFFSGTPNQTGVALTITVTAIDPYSLVASTSFNLTVDQRPQLMHNILDQTAELEKSFGFQIANDIFKDPDGDVLTYSAVQSGSNLLPSWLKLNATTGFFSGIPPQIDIIPITVTVTDPYNLTVSTGFNLAVDQRPRLMNNILNQTVEFNKFFGFQIANDTFNDPDGDDLTYSAVQSGSSILPSWLNFNATTGFFSGIPPQIGIILITVTTTDPYNLTVSTGFNLIVDQRPQLVHNILDQPVEFEKSFGFQIANDTFKDPDGDVLTYSAAQSGSRVLPSWLNFNATTGFFSGIPNQVDMTLITVTATDPYGLAASTSFNLTVQNKTAWIVGGVVAGIAAIGGLASAAYLAYKRGFFASDRAKDTATASPDTEIELTKKTAISLAG